MNDRISKIAIEADAWCDRYYFGDKFYDIEWEKKFAELIVKRCIQVCDGNHEYKNRTDTDFGKGVSVGIQMSKEQIKAHFGVEE